MMDGYLARLDALGATVALTADHGMNAKTDAAGRPQRRSTCRTCSTRGSAPGAARVILPITDPYVVHHGALGSFATVYLPAGADAARSARAPGGAARDRGRCWSARRPAARFELPPDRMGDLVVVSERHVVLGTSAARHDLSGLDAPLRSHGGVSEQQVPLLLNRRTTPARPSARLRNFDIFDLALNQVI